MSKAVTQQPEGLISVLLDTTAEFGDRDDAAMDLSLYDESEAEDALIEIALDEATDPLLTERCGEALAEIWCRKDHLNIDVLNKLRGNTLRMAASIIQARKAEWMKYLDIPTSDTNNSQYIYPSEVE